MNSTPAEEVDGPEAARIALRGKLTQGRTVQEWADLDTRTLQRCGRRMTWWLWRILMRARCTGRGNIPATGGFLLCPNHGSWIDGFIHCFGQPRDLRFMAKYEALQLPFVGPVLARGGLFPVVRGARDVLAIEIARLVLESGSGLVLYPEGTRKGHAPGELGRARSGAAVVSLLTGAPIVPAASIGIRRIDEPRRLHWPRVTTCYGEPMHFTGEPTPERVAEVRDAVWAEVARLVEQAEAIDARRRWYRRVALD